MGCCQSIWVLFSVLLFTTTLLLCRLGISTRKLWGEQGLWRGAWHAASPCMVPTGWHRYQCDSHHHKRGVSCHSAPCISQPCSHATCAAECTHICPADRCTVSQVHEACLVALTLVWPMSGQKGAVRTLRKPSAAFQGADYTSLGSFGNVEQFGENLVASLDRGFLLRSGFNRPKSVQVGRAGSSSLQALVTKMSATEVHPCAGAEATSRESVCIQRSSCPEKDQCCLS